MKKKLSFWLALILILEIVLGVAPISYAASSSLVQATTPLDGATGVALNSPIDITFKEAVHIGAGQILVLDKTNRDNIRTIEQIDVTDASKVSLDPSGLKATITLSAALTSNTIYEIQLPDGAFIGNVSGNNSAAYKWTFTTVGDNAVPTVIQYTPAASATGVALNDPLKIQFSEPVVKGTGSIRLKRVSDNNETTIDVAANNVTIDSNPASVTISNLQLQAGTRYYVLMDPGVFTDVEGNPFAGISAADTWTFTTAGGAATSIQSKSPQSGTLGVAKTTKLQLNFNRNVYPANGSIVIYKSNGGQLVKSIPVTSTQVTGGGTPVITIDPGVTFEENTQYYVTVSDTAFVDDGANPVAGITSTSGWTFTIAGSASPLTISSLSPSDGSTNVPLNSELVITFNREVQSGTGTVQVKKAGTNVITPSTISVTASNQKEVRVKFPSGLDPDSTYVVDIVKDTFKDQLGNTYAGLSGSTSWSFRTVTSDRQPPVLQSAQMINNTTIRLAYNELLDSSVALLASSFSVTVNNEARNVSSAMVSGDSVYIYLDPGVAVGQDIKISYSAGIRAVQDLGKNMAASFAQKQVTNSIDSVLPKPKDGYVSGNTLYLYFNNTLASPSPYAYTQFTVSADGVNRNIKSISQTGSTIILYLDSSVTNGQIVKVSYNPGSNPIQDNRGLNISAFTDYFVRNANDTKAPEFTGAEGSDKKVILTYNEALKTDYVPMKSQFSVLVNNLPVYVTEVLIQDNKVSLTLATTLTSTTNNTVTISYVPGTGTSRLVDLNYNSAGYINLQPVNLSGSNLIPVQNTTNMPGQTTGYLGTLDRSEFGTQMAILKSDAAAVSADQSRYGVPVHKYTIDPSKLKSAYDYVLTNNTGAKAVVFEVPASESAADVSVPLKSLEDTYYRDNGTSFAVRHGDAVYYLPLKKVKFSDVAKGFNTNSSAVNLLIRIERLSPNSSITFRDQLTKSGGQFITDPIEFYVAADATYPSYQKMDLNLLGDYYVRTQKSVPSSKSALVRFDGSVGQIAYVPTTIENAGSYNILHGKTNGNWTVAAVSNNKYFGDIDKHWAQDAISELAAKYIVEGHTEQGFEPNKNITRAEFATYMAKALGLSGDQYTARRFRDIPYASPVGSYIGAAAKAGIVSGNTDATFKPNSYITREQMAVMMVRAMEYTGYTTYLSDSPGNTLRAFKDRSKIQYPDVIAKAFKEGIIQGVSKNTFQPKGNVTRAQAAVMIKRTLEKIGYLG
ncbi:Ig-like domain-containing protein [Paenibacillus sediminis]|uniref:Repeat protein (TIGR02059 family) n=1 Tax=Paenibacillus sediminis TaxID=664909 RepID=A0ABS4H2A9_9BACL|nr:Ig-like domain-containing protein [Paenibacillus sediminis]MBP1936673.1 putative repeat protein (TIGR02059 family) [Paenibacillus sediminis]